MINQLGRIHQSSIKFLTPLNLADTYKTIVQEALKLVGAQSGSIFISNNGVLERVYSSDSKFHKIKIRPNGYTYQVFKTRKPLILTYNEIHKIHPEIVRTRTLSDIIAPLSNRNRSIGIITVQSQKIKTFTKEDLDTLKIFSTTASLAIRKTQLNEELQRALESRDLFISMASHELRTPLTTINGYIQLLHSRLKKSDGTEAKWVQELANESERLTLLVKELLEVNRIKTGELNYSWKVCSLREIITRAIKDLSFTYPERKIVFKDWAKNDQVVGDFDKLVQVIINLLGNAVSYSDPKTEVSLILKERQRSIILQVKDSGQGIKRSELGRVTENYFRGTNHSKEGMGIGLFLTRNIIEKHHGTLKIKSRLGRGTTVEIKLPEVNND